MRSTCGAAFLVIAACGATPDVALPDAATIDAAATDAGPGTPAPAGGWPISSRCVATDPGGCAVLEAETWDRSAVVTFTAGDDGTSRVTDADGIALVTVAPTSGASWFRPTGITALPTGGWVIAGALLGPGDAAVGAASTSVPGPFSYNRLVIAVDEAGDPRWHLVLEGVTAEANLVAARTDGSVVVAGEQHADTTIGDAVVAGPVWVYDFFVAATTPDGAWDWALELPEPDRGEPIGDLRLTELALGSRSEAMVLGELRGTLSAAGDTVTGPTNARAVASEHGSWLELTAEP